MDCCSACWLFAAFTPNRAACKSGLFCSRLCLKVFKISCDRLVIEGPRNIIVGVYRFISEQLPQIRKSLHSGELCGRHVRLELKHLQLELQQVVVAYVARFVTRLANIHRVLKTLEILVRQFQR